MNIKLTMSLIFLILSINAENANRSSAVKNQDEAAYHAQQREKDYKKLEEYVQQREKDVKALEEYVQQREEDIKALEEIAKQREIELFRNVVLNEIIACLNTQKSKTAYECYFQTEHKIEGYINSVCKNGDPAEDKTRMIFAELEKIRRMCK